jgi:RNA polymerase sigma factor (sigma-70 family)
VPNDTQPQGSDRFPATRWSVIDAARSGDSGERERALAALFAAYWKPVYKYVRLRWNRPVEDAQDLTQGFFAELLDRDLLAQYDPAKSRLRTFLRVCVDSFVMNQDKAAQRQKRGGNVLHVALDFQEVEGELRERVVDPAEIPAPQSMEEFFEKEWIRSLFTLAIEGLRRRCAERQREKTFLMFEEYDLDGGADTSYDQLAQKYGIPATDVTNSLSWARREFRRIALERLRELCGSQEEFQREVVAVFGRKALEARE